MVPDDPNCGDYYQDAHCEDCLAQYGAYMDGDNVTDTSFRSTHNDEPGFADFPKFAIRRGIVEKIPWSDEVAKNEPYYSYYEYGLERLRGQCASVEEECVGRPTLTTAAHR